MVINTEGLGFFKELLYSGSSNDQPELTGSVYGFAYFPVKLDGCPVSLCDSDLNKKAK